PDRENDLSAVEYIDRALEAAAANLCKELEYDLLEFNLLDISTGIFIPHRFYSSAREIEADQPPPDGYRLGEGFTGWLVENRKPLILKDLHQEDPLTPKVANPSSDLRSYLGVPIQNNSELIGTLEIAHRETGKYSTADVNKIGGIRDALAAKLTHLHKTKQLAAVRQISALQQELLQKLTHVTQLKKLVAELGKVILDRIDLDWIAFFVYDPRASSLESLSPITTRQGQIEDYRFNIPSAPDSPLTSLWRTQEYWIVNQISKDEIAEQLNLAEALENLDAERLLIAPLIADAERLGVLVAGRRAETDLFSEEQGSLFGSLGSICGPILDIAIRLQSLPAQEQTAQLSSRTGDELRSYYTDALLQITGELAASMDLDHLLARVLTMLREAVGADQGAFLLTAPDSHTLILRASSGSFPAPPPGGRPTPYHSDQGLAGWVIQNRMAVCIGDLSDDERWVPFEDENPRQHSALVAPLIVSEEVLGAVLLLGHKRHAFSDDDLELVSAAANQIAPAIHNAQLYHLIQEQAERLGLALRTQQVETSQSQAVLHAMADGVIVTDPQHKILVFNPSAEHILGSSRTNMLGKSVFDIFQDFGADGIKITSQLRSWQEHGASTRSRSVSPRRVETDQGRVLAIQPAPVVLGDDFLGTITIIRDITREVEVDRMKSEFVATVSHELRSPITPIKGFVDLLRMGIPGEITKEQSHFLEIIYQNIHRLEMLVDELLDISRIEAGKVMLSFQYLSVDQLLDELEEYLNHRSKTENKQMSFRTQMTPDIPDIWGDPERVRQILTNLVDNSFDYTPEGGTIRVDAQPAGDQIEIAVSDDGMGIAVKEQERIFERFYRGEQALIMGVAGAGLGLSIALNMVEMHGGRIWVNSAGIPGKGSTFTVSLPSASSKTPPREANHTA
ncbi:MAG: GAF domain-containing protein, partial [Anaerolineales bacterium]